MIRIAAPSNGRSFRGPDEGGAGGSGGGVVLVLSGVVGVVVLVVGSEPV